MQIKFNAFLPCIGVRLEASPLFASAMASLTENHIHVLM